MANPLPTGTAYPTGTVTFLFTDIVGSTPLWERQPDLMADALQVHNAVLRGAIEAHGGVVFKTVGDAFQAAFPTAPQALRAAIEGQRALQAAQWNALGELKVRMGLHTGEAQLDPGGDEYAVSHTKNRIGRIHSAAHGGQILLSQETADLVKRSLPEGVTLKDLGEHHLKGMEWLEHLYQVCALGLAQDFPVLPTTITYPNNLPLQRTSFIGRAAQVAQVKELVRQHALVTLTGSGGVGKTRLSLQVAGELLGEFPDGVWLVELAPVTDPGLVVQAAAATLGLKSMTSQPLRDLLLEYLRPRQALLVLDNCEHLIEACAALADDLLRACPQVKVLASSREALGVAGEMPCRVPSLGLPDLGHQQDLSALAQCEAVRLFDERARVARPDFAIEAHNAAAVAQICLRLDGIPLALELAAARLSVLSSEQLLGHLQNAFRVLTGGSRTALPRQQTLRATIDWSYRLLTEGEKKLLRRLAVFSGAFDLAAVEAVCCLEESERLDTVEGLASLTAKSMLAAEREAVLGMRYRLLETVRQYAREKLDDAGESLAMYNAHAAYYLELAYQGGKNTFTREAPVWLRRLDVEMDNLRQAFAWALEGELVVPAARALGTLGGYWLNRCTWDEGYAWMEITLVRLDTEQPSLERAGLLRELGLVSLLRPHSVDARRCLEDSRAMFLALGDQAGYAGATRWLGTAYYDVDWEACFGYYEESAAIFRELGDDENLALSLWIFGIHFRGAGLLEQGERHLRESESLYRKLGSWKVGDVYFNLACLYDLKGQIEEARSLFLKALPLLDEVQDQWGRMWCKIFMGEMELRHAVDRAGLLQARGHFLESLKFSRKLGRAYPHNFLTSIKLGKTILRLGDHSGATGWYQEALSILQEFYLADDAQLSSFGECLFGLAEVGASSGHPARSARLLGALDGLHEAKPRLWRDLTLTEYERLAQAVRAALGDDEYARDHALGRAMTLEQAVTLALEIIR